jgi:hypothetical protein
VNIVVWICPNCGLFYAASNAGDLHETWNTHNSDRTFRRSRCPNPMCAKQGIHRVPMLYAPVHDAIVKDRVEDFQ